MRKIPILICIILMVGSFTCSKKSQITYKKLFLKSGSIEYISRDIPYINSLKRKGDQIFIISKDIYEIDLREKTEKLLFKDGPGPNEVLNPNKIIFWDGDFYINSYYESKFIYKFNPDLLNKQIERFNIGKNIRFDSFGFISKNLLVMANVNWSDGLVQIHGLEKNIIKKIGKPEYIKTMEKFNVSAGILCIADGMVYVIERIKPEIKVISANQARILKSLILAPPFYIAVPSKYTPQKYDTKAHREWMASWTSISDIMVQNRWLLVRYKWGYDFLFGYELINLDIPNNRYYIDKTTRLIYDFSIDKNNIRFYMVENSKEGDLEWEKVDALF